MSRGTPADTIVSRIEMIVRKIKADSPKTKLYLQSVLPVTDHYNMFKGHTSRWQVIPEINKGLVGLAEKEGATYIDLYSHFIDKQTGKMNTTYTNDGLHLLGKGYLNWEEINEKDFTIIRLSVRLLGVVCPATDKGCMCRKQYYLWYRII